MTRCDVLIVGGGPAGSTCAWLLRRAGWDVVVADSAHFPRDKVCAGWLTLPVFPLLELDPAEYRAAGLTLQELTAFKTGVLGRPLLETRDIRASSATPSVDASSTTSCFAGPASGCSKARASPRCGARKATGWPTRASKRPW